MHQLAIALHRKGHQITGSDDEIYNPSRSSLDVLGLLPPEMGWHLERITDDIDSIILGMHAKPDNPELLKAQKLGIPVYSYPEYITRFAKDKQRVVVAGSHGKTTITASIMHVLQFCKQDFDYLVGARLNGFDNSVRLSDAEIMVMEGDEYLSSPIHRTPKIHYYQPQLALLTGIAWDHYNVFPTEQDYVDQFEIFLNKMSPGGILIYNCEDPLVCEVVAKSRHLHLIPYKTPAFQQTNGKSFWLVDEDEKNEGKKVPLKVFGQHNFQNLNGARKICNYLGIDDETFWDAIQHFEGASKRLDSLHESETTNIYRDFAHAPSKAKATTEAVKGVFTNRRLLACFELHTYSSLNKDFLPQYKGAMDAADTAVVYFEQHTLEIKKLPELTKEAVRMAFERDDLVVINNQAELVAYLKGQNWVDTNLLMMSSGTFGGLKNEDIVTFVTSGK